MSYAEEILKKAQKEKGLYWITVIENGVPVTKRITPSNKTNNCYSVSKVFTVTALGMLFDEGLLSVDERPIDILKDEINYNINKKWEQITLDNIIRHRWGIERGFLDIDAENVNKFKENYGSGNDFLKNVFSADLPNTPGAESKYSDAAYYLLSRIVSKKSDKTLFDFLRERLFVPLEFEEAAWSTCPMGYSMGATGLFLRTQDMAKLGQIYLEKGTYNGKRYISEKWCNLVFDRGYELKESAPGCYSKGGMFGQELLINTKKNIVVAWLGYDSDVYSKRMFEAATDLD